MERVWRKVNQGFSGRSSKAAAIHSHTDTISSAGFGDPQVVAAVAGVENTGTGVGAPANVVLGTSTPTGRRLASSGDDGGNVNVVGPTQLNTFSQHVIGTASSERRRKRRKKSRPRRNEFGKFFNGSAILNESSHPPDTSQPTVITKTAPAKGMINTGGDPSLRQRAVAKLRMFNFHLNWDLHMTQCKPCGPRSSGGGNILTRRLCRNRRRGEDNELYRSNSFKFERFERKEGGNSEIGMDTLQRMILIVVLFGAVSGDKLARSYFPAPSTAGIAAGNGYYLTTPFSSSSSGYYNRQPVAAYGSSSPYSNFNNNNQYNQYQYPQKYQQPYRPSYYRPSNQYGSSLVKYDNYNDGRGNYNFEYATSDGSSRKEQGNFNTGYGYGAGNVVSGSYSYRTPNGQNYKVDYYADATGFHANGDHIPKPVGASLPIQSSYPNAVTSGQYNLPSGGYSSGRPQNFVQQRPSHGYNYNPPPAYKPHFQYTTQPPKQYIPPRPQKQYLPPRPQKQYLPPRPQKQYLPPRPQQQYLPASNYYGGYGGYYG